MDEEFIRNRITELRLKKGVSEYQMSMELGQNRSYIQAISSGRSMPSMKQFLNICEYFEITPLQFFDAQENNPQLKVTRFQLSDLRSDLIERARMMTTSRTANHPWKSMSDEELLRSAGLILKDEEKQIEGITLAAILLFGKDATIMSVLPQHKTDAIFRVENLDRYDDRDVIITNLLETYDRLIAFGQKHLSDPFVQEGIHSISARDHILREIFSNSLAHRDYSSGYVAIS